VAFYRDIGLKLNGFNVPLHPIADLDFWRRLTENSNMLYVNQELAYYRISPNQSTVHLIDDMINNVYNYRLNLMRTNKVKNNIYTRLTLEYIRITGIRFFIEQYPQIDITNNIPNIRLYKFTKLLLKLPLSKRFFEWYLRKLCFNYDLSSIN
jgi:hypothetical protein